MKKKSPAIKQFKISLETVTGHLEPKSPLTGKPTLTARPKLKRR